MSSLEQVQASLQKIREEGDMSHLLYLYTGVGALFVALAVPLMRRLVGPNHWYGFRVPQTLNESHVWYEANAYAGKGFFWLGVLLMAAAVVLYWGSKSS
jgi:Na+-transporting NADH:ubiquinone oxidoreductase subunit NqrD